MKAYIFDLDGTLLDSMGIWQDIDIEFLRKRNIPIPADYSDSISALSFPEAAAYTINRFGLPDSRDDLMSEWSNMAVYAYSHTVKLKPYARDYLLALRESGVKLAVATSATPELYIPALKNNGIYDLFHIICSADEVGHGKSRPDIFLHTANKLAVSPCDCIMFEDLLVAVKSAKSIGMTVYGVYDKASEDDWEQIKLVADGTITDFRNAPLPGDGGTMHGG